MYKITIYLRTAVCFIDRPYLDGLLSFAVAKEFLDPSDFTGNLTLTKEQVAFIHDRMPLKRHQDGWFLASWMHWNEEVHVEFTDSWKKRWNEKHDHLVDFGKRVPKVKINAGEFKSYNMPLTLHQIPKVWFYCETEDVKKVVGLLSKHIWGIGKKTSQGWGEVDRIKYEEVPPIPWENLRPIPVKDRVTDGHVRFLATRPPYWLTDHYEWCLVPFTS